VLLGLLHSIMCY